jgi:hypothetical protein
MRLSRARFTTWSIVAGVGSLAAVLLLVLLNRPTAISKSEAIQRAEQFIAANGYTDLPANGSRLTPEPVVFSSSKEEELKMRHDTLERKADGAFGGAEGWMVYFRYKSQGTVDPERRRAVVMGPKGDHIHVMHQDAY